MKLQRSLAALPSSGRASESLPWNHRAHAGHSATMMSENEAFMFIFAERLKKASRNLVEWPSGDT
jgi:hypothetical protein